MPDSYWRGPLAYIALALVLGAIFSWLLWDISAHLTEQRIRNEQYAQGYTEKPDSSMDIECSGLNGVSFRNCIQQQVEATRESQQAEEDLQAQKVMARFTAIMGYAAVIGTFLGSISIFLIWKTFRETQSLGDETKSIGERQLRPYLILKPRLKTETNGGEPIFWVGFGYINVGQTLLVNGGGKITWNEIKRADMSSGSIDPFTPETDIGSDLERQINFKTREVPPGETIPTTGTPEFSVSHRLYKKLIGEDKIGIIGLDIRYSSVWGKVYGLKIAHTLEVIGGADGYEGKFGIYRQREDYEVQE